MDTDRDIVTRVKSRERRAFELLVKNHQRLVSHIVFRMIPNATDREDICQEVFISVFQKIDRFRFECQLSSWIGRIAYNRCLNHLQKKQVPLFEDSSGDDLSIDSCPDRSAPPDLWEEQRDRSRRLNEEIDQLPLRYGLVLTMYHLCEMGYAEIAQITEQPEGTIKSHIYRARKLLKERLLQRYQPEELWQTGT
jgi:RNA polymerase sigma factor (sigma-70 family)